MSTAQAKMAQSSAISGAVSLSEAGRHPHKQAATPLRVLLDARKLGDGGIGTYIDRLIAALTLDSGVAVTIIAKDSMYELYPWSDGVTAIIDPAARYSLDELLFMPRRIDFSQFDLFHEPHFTLPFGIPIPTIVTIHDLIHLTHPERAYYPFFARKLIRSAIKRATKVVAVSYATADAISKEFADNQIRAQKVRVVTNMLGRKRQNFAERALERNSQRGALNLLPTPQSYLLAVLSNSKPHKGLQDLLQSWSALVNSRMAEQREQFQGVKLVLVGYGVNPNGIRIELQRLNIFESVVVLGVVSEPDLHRLHAGALALVVPSLAEGFCLPALESQSFCVPVVMRPVPVLQEIACAQDQICADFSIGALSEAISSVVDRVKSNGSEMSNGAMASADHDRHLERFQPDTVLRQLMAVYREALGIAEPVEVPPTSKGESLAGTVG